MAMKKIEPVQRGWAGNADAAQEEKARWKTVTAQVPRAPQENGDDPFERSARCSHDHRGHHRSVQNRPPPPFMAWFW